jgi:DNA-binding NarL/FixJ family response regulator
MQVHPDVTEKKSQAEPPRYVLLEREEQLTPREREVLACFAEGLGSESIARRLAIAKVTVRNHAQRILSKLRVHSRLAAVARGYRDGLIERDGEGR